MEIALDRIRAIFYQSPRALTLSFFTARSLAGSSDRAGCSLATIEVGEPIMMSLQKAVKTGFMDRARAPERPPAMKGVDGRGA